ncbi:arylsulfatase [Salinibacterium sp. G-O1]|uniref:arylsulfatase n=1 Tax=Salinibacterium sp. G-O1 TaxID=3046208 RepID=UPI0024BB7BDD|nr:arylsulfatase [Salinibacterium sp. G-O1]MDJ0336398.1 arylsulfatase [Salinibacterium sp. G-O1]
MNRPDIVLILADDLGFSDLGCYGGELNTPTLDRLGREGVRMSQFYNTARCSPSRASLLTGLHPHQTGIGVLTRPDLPRGYPGNLSESSATVAEHLSEAGWRTWLSGKWHLSGDVSAPSGSWPTRRGFQKFFGTLAGCSSYFDPQTLTRGEDPAPDARRSEFYYTDAISDEAVGWIRDLEAEGSDDPFFLYLAYTAPHWPLHAQPEIIANNSGKFDAGWDSLRAERLERMVSEGIIDEGSELSTRDPSQPAWQDAEDQKWQARRMEAYAAQVESMDRGIGRVLQAMADAGRLENALVIFLADNGASAEELPIGDLASFAQKDAVLRSGTRDGHDIRAGNRADIDPGPEDTYASYGVPWANLSNTPLRRYKRWVHEGGISTPFIAHWPAGQLATGSVVTTAHQLVDVLPTILTVAGITPDSDAEGSSMLASLRGEDLESDRTLFWEHIGNAAIRRGRWKLVKDFPSDWELYDIDADRSELHDRATEQPELVTELTAAWQTWANRVGVIPWDRMLDDYAVEGKSAQQAEE